MFGDFISQCTILSLCKYHDHEQISSAIFTFVTDSYSRSMRVVLYFGFFSFTLVFSECLELLTDRVFDHLLLPLQLSPMLFLSLFFMLKLFKKDVTTPLKQFQELFVLLDQDTELILFLNGEFHQFDDHEVESLFPAIQLAFSS